MSEAVADSPRLSGYKTHESRALTNLLNNWFEGVVQVIPPEKYTGLGAGDAAPLCDVQGLGQITLRYEGSRYQPRTDDEPNRPLQRCEYTLSMGDGREGADAVGWWMPLHMEYGPKLVVDTPASTEELMGSTSEDRRNLERLVGGLHFAYISAVAGPKTVSNIGQLIES
jgi:hypothetical protein